MGREGGKSGPKATKLVFAHWPDDLMIFIIHIIHIIPIIPCLTYVDEFDDDDDAYCYLWSLDFMRSDQTDDRTRLIIVYSGLASSVSRSGCTIMAQWLNDYDHFL